MPHQPAPIMLLGTFHFADRGLDAYKPSSIFDPVARQAEVQEVIACLTAYEPTKIALERHADEQASVDREYRDYMQDNFQLPADEIYQLGFQLTQRLGHKSLYGVNAWGRYYDPPFDFEQVVDGRSAQALDSFVRETYPNFHPDDDLAAYAERQGQTHLLTEWDVYYHEKYEHEDGERLELTLRDILRQANEAEEITKGHGTYMVGSFKVGAAHEYLGVDVVTAWYNRNLRIFANLQRITETGDRLLLIIGGGHVPILRHCVQASPEYDLVEVSDYL